MIASAVVVPEDSTPFSTNGLKRRQSSVSDEHHKRPKLDTPESADAAGNETVSPPPASATEATSRRYSRGGPVGREEERKRGKRLFGGILGALSQTSSTSAQKRRADIEKKQQAKLQQQIEEDSERKQQKAEELLAARKVQQRLYDKQVMQSRHSSSLSMAHFLRTEAEPRLYYKPWELSRSDENRITRQIETAEEQIQEELRNFERADPETGERGDVNEQNQGQIQAHEQLPNSSNEETQEDLPEASANTPSEELTHVSKNGISDTKNPSDVRPGSDTEETHNDEDLGKEGGDVDDNDEMMVEAGEDPVLY